MEKNERGETHQKNSFFVVQDKCRGHSVRVSRKNLLPPSQYICTSRIWSKNLCSYKMMKLPLWNNNKQQAKWEHSGLVEAVTTAEAGQFARGWDPPIHSSAPPRPLWHSVHPHYLLTDRVGWVVGHPVSCIALIHVGSQMVDLRRWLGAQFYCCLLLGAWTDVPW
jgi:hypothetical protein